MVVFVESDNGLSESILTPWKWCGVPSMVVHFYGVSPFSVEWSRGVVYGVESIFGLLGVYV